MVEYREIYVRSGQAGITRQEGQMTSGGTRIMNYELIHSLRMYFTATPEMLEKRQLHAHPRNTRNRRPNTNAEGGEREREGERGYNEGLSCDPRLPRRNNRWASSMTWRWMEGTGKKWTSLRMAPKRVARYKTPRADNSWLPTVAEG